MEQSRPTDYLSDSSDVRQQSRIPPRQTEPYGDAEVPHEHSRLLAAEPVNQELLSDVEDVPASRWKLKWRGASPRQLYGPFLLYCLAVGAVAVPKVNIILALMCIKGRHERRTHAVSSEDICAEPAVYAEMGRFMVYANLISGVLCAYSSPRLGKLSDRYGRKPLIAFSAMGMLLGDIISVTAAWFPDRISVYWILMEFVCGGLTGAFFTTVALVQSYAADCTPCEERARVFGLLHACMYTGLALGPAAGALLVRCVGSGNMLTAFYAAGACHAIFICYTGVWIQESLPTELRLEANTPTKPSKNSSSPRLRRVLKACNVLRPLSILRPAAVSQHDPARSTLPTLAAIDTVVFGVQVGLPPLLIVFSERRLRWTNFEANLFLSITNATRATILAVILPLAMRLTDAPYSKRRLSTDSESTPTSHYIPIHHRPANLTVACVSLFFCTLGLLGFAVSHHPILFTCSGIMTAAGAAISPIAQSTMTRYFQPNKLGEFFGAISLLHSLARAFLPAMMQLLYSFTVGDSDSAVFWALGALFAIVLLISLRIRP